MANSAKPFQFRGSIRKAGTPQRPLPAVLVSFQSLTTYNEYMKTTRILAWLGILSVFCIPHAAKAVAPYFEFNPDYAQSLLVASNDTIVEAFLPLNEFLSGFDLWLSNGDQASDVTVELRNSQNALLATKTLSLESIPDSDEGTRVHIGLASQIAVAAASPYTITIISSDPSLRLYYADQTRLLPHNGAPAETYNGGLARIGGQDQTFSFKFALYESHESSPPVISNAQTSQQVIDQVKLTFNANEPVDSHIQYGSSIEDWTGTFTSCPSGVQLCTVYLPVTPSTTYDYTLTVRDTWGNTSTFSGVFTSLAYGQTPAPTPTPSGSSQPTPASSITPTPTPDILPPVITNPRAVNLTPTSAGFAWTTNEAANGTVVVQLTPLLITAGGNSDATLELEHYIVVGNLTPDTYYQATITSADAVNNKGTATVTFLSPKTTPAPTPPPSQPTPTTVPANPSSSNTPAVTVPAPTPGIIDNGSESPTLSWAPPASGEPSGGYRVDIFDSNNHLLRTVRVAANVHQLNITGLQPGETRAVVYANNGGIYEKVGTPTKVTIRKKSFLERMFGYAPYILGAIILSVLATVVILKLKKPAPPTTLPPPSIPPPPITAP
jgi:hypothetical protein